MRRRTACAAALLALAPLAACSGSDEPGPAHATAADSCPGGDIRILQGQPHDLPGGGSTGIGDVDMADPPTVRLVFASPGLDNGQTKPEFHVGDTFAVQGTTYRVDCISRSKVTLSQDG